MIPIRSAANPLAVPIKFVTEPSTTLRVTPAASFLHASPSEFSFVVILA
jgi:hypothetical protein